MFTLNKKPCNSFEVVQNGFALYRFAWTKGFWLSFIVVILILGPVYWPHILAPNSDQEASQLFETLPFQITLLSCWLIAFVLMCSLIFKLHCICHGLQCSYYQAIKHSMSRCIPTFLVGLLYIIAVVSGTALLIVPGFILAISLMFCLFLAINENKGIILALVTSHRLVWGHWWHSLASIAFPLFIMISANMLVVIITASLFKHFQMPLEFLFVFAFGLQVFIQSILIPLGFCIALVLLHDLRVRKDYTSNNSFLKYR